MNCKKVFNRIHITVLLLLFTGSIIHAQVSKYTFATTTGLPLGGGPPDFICSTDDISIKQRVTINAQGFFVFPPGQMDYIYTDCQGSRAAVVSGPGFPIGFDFVYDGQVFDRFAVSANGYIKLGKSGEDIVMYNDTLEGGVWKDGNNALRANVISAQQLDVHTFTHVPNDNGQPVDGGFTIGINTGLPGQRVLLITGGYGMTYHIETTFYICLFEGSNKISISFRGPVTYDPAVSPTKVAVGLRGKEENNSIENLNIRKVTQGVNTWATSVAGTSAADLCDFSSVSVPSPDYLTYTWTPPVVPVPPVCPFIYLTDFIFGSGPTESVPSDYPSSLIYGRQDGNGLTGQGALWYRYADGAADVPRNPVLSWSPVTYLPTTYDVYFGTDNPPVTLVSQNQATTSYAPSAPYLAPNTAYYYKIVAKNTYGTSPGCIGKMTTGSMLKYCERVPSRSYASKINFNEIAFTYTFGNESIRTRPETAPYTTTIQRKETYSLSVTAQNPLPSGEGGYIDCSFYIDWNLDGDFDDAGESYVLGSMNPGATRSQNVIVPATAVLGKTIMRVRTTGQNENGIAACNPFAATTDFIVTIAPSTACTGFTIHPVKTDASCFGKSDGSIDLNVAGGAEPYAVTWTDGSTDGAVRTNLPRGIYQASSVTDAAGCEVSTPLMAVLQPGRLQLDTATVAGHPILTVMYGTAPYTYQWSNDSTSSDPAYFTPGMYDVTVTDAHGCDTSMHTIVIKAHSITTSLLSAVDAVSAGIVVFPNPGTGTVYVKVFTQQEIQVQIINEQGTIMQEGYYMPDGNNTVPVNVTSLVTGMYFLRVIDEGSAKMIKFMKQ